MKLFWFLCILMSSYALQAQQPDVLAYRIRIQVLHFLQKQIEGHTTIQIVIGTTDSLQLDLASFTVDSVLWNGQLQSFRRDSQQLTLLFSNTQVADTHVVDVFYHGTPLQDPDGFGACLWQDSTFAFNLGVSLNIEPHNMGKAWFPCRDNFTDKALFETQVTVPKGMKAICGGTLQQIEVNSDSTSTFYWKLRDPIPTYLASYAISNYDAVTDTFTSVLGQLPVSIYVSPSDTAKVRGSFFNLQGTVAYYENLFGPYYWERVGYVAVPFNGGAMEHATNIAYPKSFIDGFQVNEIYMAHELAHSWFGNLVTCEKAEEMWLNEGWASYTETLFKEHFYGKQAAKDYLRKQHYDVLTKAKIYDGAHYPLSNVPQSVTYGLTVYSKGATVAHSLRGTLGDSLFFNGLKYYLNQLKFKNANSDSLQKYIEQYSQQNLTDFFQTWVHTPGHPHFAIDSFAVQPMGSTNQITIAFRQRLRNRTSFAHAQKVRVALIDNQRNREDQWLTLTGETCTLTLTSNVYPTVIWLDPEEELEDASTDLYLTVSAPTTVSNGQTMGQFFVTAVHDTALVRYECNWVAPGGTVEEPGVFVGSRYWEISGTTPDTLVMKAKFEYNGSNVGNGAYEDTWLTFSEDSLLLLYRKNPYEPWTILNTHVQKNLGVKTDKRGNFVADTLTFGQYAIGYYDRSQIARETLSYSKLKVYPNPADQKIELNWEGIADNIELISLEGKSIQQIPVFGSTRAWLNTSNVPNGTYLIRIKQNQTVLYHTKVIIQR